MEVVDTFSTFILGDILIVVNVIEHIKAIVNK